MRRAYATTRKKLAGHARPLFDKILIANRGEIACRIVATCRRMGIRTVAVYSEADRDSLHCRLADERVCVGPAASRDSYLNVERILQAVRETKAQAVHPGYGFLSENSQFAQTLQEREGTVFIGPSPQAMRDLGDKIASKRIAREAGVPGVPGYDGAVPDVEAALRVVRENIGGYPVMIKASAGGGGKGMRVARSDAELREMLPLAASEALRSFGDDRLLVERFVEAPRHIEVQILADTHGTVLHLPERDCSVQRRNQKVIEEAPSPALTAQQRKQMGECAARLAAAVGYSSAGTVEFLYDNASKEFYFLEMNTRLQVEHPVTELVTNNIDLVEQMIRVAAGLPLSVQQADVDVARGWAVEARLYAEDPLNNYLPSVGQLTRYREPAGSVHFFLCSGHADGGSGDAASASASRPIVRCDSGVEEGTQISVHYDPMICKLCTWAETRSQALDHMTLALDSFVIQGVVHNRNLLRQVINEPKFRLDPMAITTQFLPEAYPDGFKGHQLTDAERRQLAVGSLFMHVELEKMGYAASPDYASSLSTAPLLQAEDTRERTYWVSVDGGKTYFQSRLSGITSCALTLDEKTSILDVLVPCGWRPHDPVFRVKVDGEALALQLEQRCSSGAYAVTFMGTKYDIVVRTEREHGLSQWQRKRERQVAGNVVASPMPGTVIRVDVSQGSTVDMGQDLCVVEAMKMQNVLKSDRRAVVKAVHIAQGDTVRHGQVLIEFEE